MIANDRSSIVSRGKTATEKATSVNEISEISKITTEKKTSSAKNRWQRLLGALEVKQHHNGSNVRAEGILESYLFNDDLAPVEEKRRVWSWKEFVLFRIAGGFNVNTWQISATGLQLGLNWWQTWICVWFGYIFVAFFLVLASRVGSSYHISFPISSRMSFGIYFSSWIILNRVVMACVWYSTLAYIGGDCVQLMLESIFGNDLSTRIKDTISNKNLTTYEFMCFMLFWGCSLPVLLMPPHTLRYLFRVKSAVTPVAAVAFLIWTLKRSHGNLALGSLNKIELKGSALAWAVIRSIMSALDNFATLILNVPDLSRFAKTAKSATYSQFFVLPFCYSIISLLGILATSAAYTMYGVNYWSILDILRRFLEHQTAGTRAGVFLISFAFAIGQLGTNVSSNSISAGTDMTALLPKFINIRRGSYICAIISLVICPWNLMASSSKFTTALSAYAVFLSSIAGVVAADYYVVRKGLVALQHCYTNYPTSFYMYGNRYGTNWRALVAYILGMVPNFPGFIASVGGGTVPEGAMHLFRLNYFVGWLISFVIYSILCYYWPVPGMPENVSYFDFSHFFEHWVEVEDFASERRNFLLQLQGSGTVSIVDSCVSNDFHSRIAHEKV
ncbi:LAFE_0A08372g1_1 [Lachancea fermentati]|uniref:LAFE_0A08372g1_1 n=1 Tax=Lachancea fermentati TaxID=4955 RepID=A0A1G4M759_LACFM|nr:LAFE_0A08372g1_1 [Lachancea fermentati]